MELFIQEYNNSIVNIEQLKKEISQTLEQYETRSRELKDRLKAPVEPDEDGWITVRSKKGKDPTKRAIVKDKAKKLKKEKKDKLLNFYSFEIRESKLKQLQELRDKFEEDKKRLAAMRASRKFAFK